MKTFCPNCSQEVEIPDNTAESSVPCPACGVAFTPEETKTCRHCGALNPKTAAKCKNCGKSILSIGIRKPGAAAPAPAEPEKTEPPKADRPKIGIRKPGAAAPAPAEPEKTEPPKADRPKIAIRKPGAAAPAPAEPEKTEPPKADRPKIGIRKPGAAAPAPAEPEKVEPPKADRPKIGIRKPGAAAPAPAPAEPEKVEPPKADQPKIAIRKPGGATPASATPPTPAAPAAGGPPKLNLTIPKPGVTPAAPAAGGPPKLNLTPPPAPAAPQKKAEIPSNDAKREPSEENASSSNGAKRFIRIAVSVILVAAVLGIAGAMLYRFAPGAKPAPAPQAQPDESIKSEEPGQKEDPIRQLERSAKQGDRHAAARLGEMYLKGEGGVTEDLSKAVELFRSAEGDPLAHFRLGQLYAEGKGVDRDPAEAVKHYEIAANGGHSGAALEYARCFAEGFGVKKDEHKAMPWRKKLAEDGDPEAQYLYARAILHAKELPEGVNDRNAEAKIWLEKSARKNYTPALFLYPMVCLDSGEVAESELTQLFQQIRSAAEAGYPPALFAMGDIAAAAGKSGEAEAWYEKAADKNFVPALIQLKRRKGKSALIREAADAGYIPAQAEEARVLLRKERREKSGKMSEVCKKMEELRSRGYSACLNELGVVAYEKDRKSALKFFKKAAAEGSACALFNIGVYTYREENRSGNGSYPQTQEIFGKLRADHPDFTRIPQGLDEELGRLMKLETEFKKLNKKHKTLIRDNRQRLTSSAKAEIEKNEKDIEKMRNELDAVTASLKKKLDWITESDYSWYFRKAPPKFRYPWIPATELTPLKAVYE